MINIYAQQLAVIGDFQKYLSRFTQNGMRKRDSYLSSLRSSSTIGKEEDEVISTEQMIYMKDMMEKVENRKFEIQEMENAAIRICEDVS